MTLQELHENGIGLNIRVQSARTGRVMIYNYVHSKSDRFGELTISGIRAVINTDPDGKIARPLLLAFAQEEQYACLKSATTKGNARKEKDKT